MLRVPVTAKRLLDGDFRLIAVIAAAILALSIGLGLAISFIVRQAVADAVVREAETSALSWAGYFAKHLDGIEGVIATGKVDHNQLETIRDAAKIGQVFRFKLYDRQGRLVLVSDEAMVQPEQDEDSREHSESAREVLEQGNPSVMVEEGEGKPNRPPLYAEAYVPVTATDGSVLGVAEAYVDVTETESLFSGALRRTGLFLAVIAALAFGLPAAAFIFRNMQALALARRSQAEAQDHAAAMQKLSGDLAVLNGELANNMQKLGAANEELLQREKMSQLGKLTATVAHELRNPLTTTRTSVYLLDRKLAGKGLGIEPIVARITNGITRCDAIITQLLDFSRSGGVATKPTAFDSWLEKVLEDVVQQLPEQVAVNFQPGAGDTMVPIDGDRLQRAVINLVNNASEALVGKEGRPIDDPTPDPRITITTGIAPGEAWLTVADNGPGIPDSVMARIREPLFTTKNFGTGLGVPAVENIARQHGGSLEINSTPGKGARFTLRLPAEVRSRQAA